MQKWSCSRCGRIMTQKTICENCGSEEVYDLASSVEVDDFHDQAMTSRVTEVLDSSQFTRDKSEDDSDIDEQISESAIACKEEEMAFFDSQASAKGDIFEETSLEDSVDATMVLGTKPSKEPSAPTVFIPTDSEIRQAFGEQPINATDETFVHPQIPHSQLGGFPKDTQPKSLPHVGGSALASTREQEEGPSRFQRSDVIGGIFGRCRVVEKISEGAMGRVYKAYHQTLDKTVVLKELPPSLASSQELRERFIREAKACAKIHHQNVVQVLDAGYENGIYFYIMEYVDGFTVEEMLTQKKKLSVERACKIIIDAAKGLHTAHQQGVVHRDIKASNIMVTRQGQVKVADFGLACDLGSSKISVAGQIMGTPQYMSPEQWDGAANVDARSDLYSLGITFYYMLADRLPFDSGSTVTLFKQHISEKPPGLKALNPDIPPALIKIVNKLMYKDREKRYRDAQELVEDLESFLRDNHKRSAVRRKVVMFSVVMAFVAGIAYAHNLGYTQKVLNYIQAAMKASSETSDPDKNNIVHNETTEQGTPEVKNGEQQVENSQQSVEQTENSEQGVEKIQGTPHETTPKENTEEHSEENTSQQENNEQKNNSEQQTENTQTNPDIKKETMNEQANDNVQDTGEKAPQKIEVVLPRIQVKMKKRIFNTSDVAVYGKISGKLLTDMKIFLLVQKNNRLHKKQNVLIKGNKFFAKMRLSDGKYKVVPQVMHVKEHKKRIGRVLSFVIDSQPPTVTVLSPNREQVFYEEQVGNSVAIKVEIRDFLKIATAFVYQQNRKIPLRSQGSHYAGDVTLQYGKQSLYVVAYDQARNMQKVRLEWALVPRNMVRIPGGTITVNGQVVNFKTFYMNKSEVTNAQYAQYLQKSGAQHPLRWKPENTNAWRNKPVVFVSYDEAVRYCQFQKKRLPSEVEWVAAALWDQNKLRKYPWGESGDVAWPRKIKEVTSWSADTSHFGIHDMAGNVSEWVQNSDQDKAMRKGGNFILNPRYLKRMLWDQVNFMEPKSSRKNWLGFRCAFSE